MGTVLFFLILFFTKKGTAPIIHYYYEKIKDLTSLF